MNQTTVTGLWIGDRLSPIEQLCIASFRHHGYEFQLFVMEDVDGVPAGTVLRDANDILRREDRLNVDGPDAPPIAYLSDRFRYQWLYEEGGWWVDMDTICLKQMGLPNGTLVGSEGRPERKTLLDRWTGKRRFQGKTFANIGFLKFPAGTEVMKYCAEESAALLKSGRSIRWGETGPALLRTALKKYGQDDWVLPWKTYCPVHHWQWRDLIEPAELARLKQLEKDPQVSCVHLWNELWRRSGVEKDQPFGTDTYVGYLLDRYDVQTAVS